MTKDVCLKAKEILLVVEDDFLFMISDADPDVWIQICIIKSDLDPEPDPYGEIRIWIRDKYAMTKR